MITLRETSDLRELMEWRREVIANVFGREPDAALMDANLEYYRNNIPSGRHIAFVAEADGIPAGCGAICLSEELPSPDNPSGRCAYLMNIYVRKEFRAHGLGHDIVRILVETAREKGCGKIYLETTPEGRPLYESLGFKDMKDMLKL